MVSKALERNYAESAMKLLNADWKIQDIEEPPDFEVQENGLVFGLEIRQVFTSGEEQFGSTAKREESKNTKLLADLARRYYALGGTPIVAQLLGSLSSINPDLFAEALVESAPRYPGNNAEERIQGVKVFMTPLPLELKWTNYSRWTYVNDRVGWVRTATIQELQEAVNRKEANLGLYKQKYEHIDLLLVADRLFNSGKLQGGEGLCVNNPGFRRIYFLSHPESIQRIG